VNGASDNRNYQQFQSLDNIREMFGLISNCHGLLDAIVIQEPKQNISSKTKSLINIKSVLGLL
jgi:hypothetical protein